MKSLPLLALITFVSANAFAQASDYRTEDTADGYAVRFHDDPLQANTGDANGPLIRVRKGPLRQSLIRVRTQFIGEMIKSVERL